VNPIERAEIDLDAPSTGPVRPAIPLARRPAVWLLVAFVTLGVALAVVTHPSRPAAHPAGVSVRIPTEPPALYLSDDGGVGEETTDDGTVMIAVGFENYSRDPIIASDPNVVMAPGFSPISVQILPGTSGDVVNRWPGVTSGPILTMAPRQHASVVITFHLSCTAPATLSPYIESISVVATVGANGAIRELTPDLSVLGPTIRSTVCPQ
jgi:hypothetical protein